MYTANVQSVLRCGRCNKPFDKRKSCFLTARLHLATSDQIVLIIGLLESTLKRHWYYCRSRIVGSTTRPRSCIICARGKQGCDSRRPQCSRCKNKGTECHYPTKSPRDVTSGINHGGDDAATEPGEMALSSVATSPITHVDNPQDASYGDEITLDNDATVLPDPYFIDIGDLYLDWGNIDISLVDFLDTPTEGPYHNTLSISPSALHSTPSTKQIVQIQQGLTSPDILLQATPSSAFRSLVKRPETQPGAQGTTNLILRTLNTYPLMLLRHDNLPPFIHPSLVFSDVDNTSMEPLNNCMSLMYMICGGVQGDRKLLWTNVRMECERFLAEVGRVFKKFFKCTCRECEHRS